MGQSSVEAKIKLNGSVESGFNQMVSQLEQFGNTVNQLSQKAQQLLGDSVNVYRSYEDSMLDARGALSGMITDQNQLNRTMETLEKSAAQWASSSIFHTNDVASAIAGAAHAGWSLDQIMTGIPQAMKVAQAGGMDLSTTLDYMIKIMNSTGTEFSDMSTLSDMWVKAANTSATTVQELGEAFMSMGMISRLGGTNEEVLTLLATMANVGTTGSEAGIALRNAMMRLIAPTEKASKVMGGLNATTEEMALMSDEGLAATGKRLEELGFSVYDEAGNLKPMLQIFKDLNAVLPEGDEKIQILADIFKTRSTATALALLEAAGNDYGGMLEGIVDSSGYATSVGAIMMSGYTGAIETLNSKLEETQRLIGKTAAPAIENIAGFVGSMVDSVNALPPEVWAAFTGGLETLAAVGPAILGGVGVAKFFTLLGPWGSTALVASVGIGALVGYLQKLDEINWESKFGQMDINSEELATYVDALQTKFDNEKKAMDAWNEAMDASLKKYQESAVALNKTLIEDAITGKPLTTQEIENIKGYGEQVYTAMLDGIKASQGGAEEFLHLLFGGDESADSQAALALGQQFTESGYSQLYSEAYAVGAQLRSQMTAALADNTLNAEEQQAIQATLDRMNQITARIQAAQDQANFYAELHRAQSVSWDSAEKFLEGATERQAAELAGVDELYHKQYGNFRALFDETANGTVFKMPDGSTMTLNAENRESVWQMFETQFNQEWAASKDQIRKKYDSATETMIDTLLGSSGEFGGAWQLLKRAKINEDGSLDLTDLFAGMNQSEVEEAERQLLALVGDHELTSRLPVDDEFWNTPQGQRITALLQGGEAAAQEAGGWRDWLQYNDGGTVPTQLLMQEAHVENLREQLAQYQAELDASGGTDVFAQENVNTTAATLAEAEAILAKLRGEAEKPAEMPVIAKVDSSAVDSYVPNPKFMTVVPMYRYAEGGRATSASIFGEAGPEWAIPEAHTNATADLLNAARQASGFTWGELIERNGGLGAGESIINYSPVINAGDASGVAEALAADKERLKRILREALRENRIRDRAAAYA